MTLRPDDWARLEPLLDAALDLPPAERGAYLDGLDLPPEERARLDALLAADADDAPVLDHPDRLGVLVEAADLGGGGAAPGTRVGPYRVVREIGRGGMGTVHLAERADGAFDKQVALKLVRPGVAEGLLARFRAERQILARLDHPGIARLLDGGRADDGRPFLVMEHVAGQPITAYCDTRRLSVEDRLALFGQVCDAVAYAHRQLVVHRDLKPSNILVTDGGRVKLLDFGIAKLLDDGAERSLVRTATEQRLLTPAYAAPEQVRGEPPTTATDVYALGVLLYELLTGRRPYRLPSRARHAVERAILEAEPTRPSTAVTEPTDDAPTATLAEARGAEPGRLRRRLAGDLDAVVLTALRKDPDRRYGSADAFGRDVRRHLDGLPVEARADSAAYRAGRFVRRHRAGVAAAALMAVLSLVYVVTLRAERDRARTSAETADAVTEFVVGLFAAPDPSSGAGRDLTVLAALDGADERIEADLGSQPAVQARLYDVLGRLHVGLGGYEAAARFQDRAADLLRALHGQRHPDLASALLWTGRRLHLEGRYAEADSVYRLVEAALPARAPDGLRPRLLADQGINALRAGDPSAADSLLRLAVTREEARAATDSLHLAYALNELAVAVHDAGDLEEAEALNRRALGIRLRHLPPMSADVGRSYNDLGLVLRTKGDHDGALVAHERAVAVALAVYGRESENTAAAYNGLAMAHRGAMRYARADSAFAASEAIVRATVGPEHPVFGFLRTNRGTAARLRGDAAEAERQLREATALLAATIGPGNPRTALARLLWGDALADLDRLGDALAAYDTARDALAEAFGPDHWEAAQATARRARVLARMGDAAAALAEARRALAAASDDAARDDARLALATAHLADDDRAAARAEARRVLARLDADGETRSERRAATLVLLARAAPDVATARRRAREALMIWDGRVAPTAPRVREAAAIAG